MPRLGAEAPLVGRASELAQLTGALGRAAAGQPAVVLVCGDAGVGKTRLLAEFAARARAGGSIVLAGHCLDLGAVGLPYLPFAEALHQLAESGEAGRAAVRSRPALSRLLPAPGLDGPEAERPGSREDVGQLQLFDAVSGLLGEIGDAAPVVLALEDLHWADQSTRDMLAFLVARLRSERLVVVASYRADDLHRRHPLRPLLGELFRLAPVERVDLAPFTAAEMRQYLRALHGGPLPERVVRSILDRSEGNAYFAEELLAAADDDDADLLPTGLADVLLARLELLPPAVQHVTRVASVAGRRVGHALLQEASGLPEDETEAALREAVTHHVLVPEGRERYAFRHALLQEAVYGDLLPGERVRLHATYARLLGGESGTDAAPGRLTDPTYPRGQAAELAYHSLESNDLPGALAASVRAAAEAVQLGAPTEALRHLEQALQLWDAVPDAEALTGRTPVQMALRAAAAAGRAGELHRAVALAVAARDQTDPAGNPAQAADVRRKVAYHLLGVDRTEEAFAEVGEALRLVPSTELSPVRVRALATYARSAINLDRDDAARTAAEEALAGGRVLGLADAEADALATLAILDEGDGELDRAWSRLAEARERAAAAGDLMVEARVVYNLAANRFYVGDLAAAVRVLDDGVEWSRRAGLTWSPHGIELRVLQVIARYCAGDWDASEAAAELAGDRPPDLVMARLATAALYVEVGRGCPGAADQMRYLKSSWHQDGQIALVAGGCEADLALWAGDVVRAAAAVEETIAWLRKTWGKWSLGGIWLAALGIAAQAGAAEQARLRRDEAAELAAVREGRRLAEFAHATAARGRPRGGRLGPEGRAWLARVDAELTRLEGASDPERWQAALDVFGYGHPYEQARCRWRLAEALLAADRRDEAAEHVALAHRVATDLGAAPLVAALEAVARRGRLDAGLSTTARAADAVLTARERDVLALLAQGRTNRQIGQALFISEKTASVHVSNIIGKLGASGRTEAVALAHQQGLLTVPA